MAQLPSAAAMVDGQVDFAVRLSTGGYQQITAHNVTQPTMEPSITEVEMISSGFHLEADVAPTTVQAGSPFTLSVRVTNDAGSVMQEINSFVTVAVINASTQDSGRGVLASTSVQLLQGHRQVTETYTYAEDIVLVVSDDAGNQPAQTGVLTVLPGAPAEITLTSDPEWVRGARSAEVTARVVDSYQNGVPDQPVTFTLLTSFGLLTVGGAICFVLGSLMLFDGPIPDMRVSLGVVLPTAVVVAGMTVFLLGRVIRAHKRQVMTGRAGLVGEVGKALSDLDPDGKVLVHGEYWDARTTGGAIAKGSDVRVEAVGERRIDVGNAGPEAPSEGSV